MKLFRKRTKYEIVCDRELHLKVQDFAMNHGIEKTVIEVRVRNSLPQNDNRISISFVTHKQRDEIISDLTKEFKSYELLWKENHIFVKTKEES